MMTDPFNQKMVQCSATCNENSFCPGCTGIFSDLDGDVLTEGMKEIGDAGFRLPASGRGGWDRRANSGNILRQDRINKCLNPLFSQGFWRRLMIVRDVVQAVEQDVVYVSPLGKCTLRIITVT